MNERLEIFKALVAAQTQIRNAEMDSSNPHFRSKYASLEAVLAAVKSAANAHNISIVQTMGRDDFGDYVETTAACFDGSRVQSKCYLVLDKQTMQGLGSAITYARRYSLAAMFAIGQDDDDGNRAEQEAPRTSTKTQNKPAQAPVPTDGVYRLDFTKKYIGKTLEEIGRDDVDGLYRWLHDQARKDGKDLDGKALRFCQEAEVFLELDVSF